MAGRSFFTLYSNDLVKRYMFVDVAHLFGDGVTRRSVTAEKWGENLGESLRLGDSES